MSEPRRRWFQIHLSTAIVLMFAAGGLLWLNLARSREYIFDYDLTQRPAVPIFKSYVAYGWPITADRNPPSILFIADETGTNLPIELPRGLNDPRAWWNLPINLSLLFLVSLASELITRRREQRRT